MQKKHSLSRGLCLLGFAGVFAAGSGCSEVKHLRVENQQLSANVSSLQEENADLLSKADQYKSELDRLENSRRELEEKLKGTGATVKIKEGAVAVSLPGAILFDSGQTILRSQCKTVLKKIASIIITEAPNEMVRIEGHTDNDPISKQKEKFKSNWELSTARAAAVLHFFVEDCGIPPTRVYIAGFGQYQPIDDNSSTAGKAKNRRVEFVIIPKGSGG